MSAVCLDLPIRWRRRDQRAPAHREVMQGQAVRLLGDGRPSSLLIGLHLAECGILDETLDIKTMATDDKWNQAVESLCHEGSIGRSLNTEPL